jgi:hypothetical protein
MLSHEITLDSAARLTVGGIKASCLHWEGCAERNYLMRTYGELSVEHLNRQANLWTDI